MMYFVAFILEKLLLSITQDRLSSLLRNDDLRESERIILSQRNKEI